MPRDIESILRAQANGDPVRFLLLLEAHVARVNGFLRTVAAAGPATAHARAYRAKPSLN
jgi:hypothetical protein